MAAAPRGAQELDYGAEENAILDATGALGLDLMVEESGNPDRLAECIAEAGAMQALHLSCHGRSEPEPVLLLEDDEGNRLETGAPELVENLAAHLPRLLFLSACQTAAAGTIADPLALTLIRAGVPSVLGWDGSVYDHEATAFAHDLYHSLALRQTLEQAVAAARRALLQAPRPSRDWHLARLWLGPAGGGILVGGKRRRRMLAADYGHKAFLDKRKGRSPVASREAFVGRRRELQTGLRVLREGEHAGLLIHGMGRLGKSSLAARIAHRRQDLETVVIFGAYDAQSIAQAIRDGCPQARDLIDARRGQLQERLEALEDLLLDLLNGPLAQEESEKKPILLVIDDLERILDEPVGGQKTWQVKPAYLPVLRAVLRAFSRAHTASRLLLTSRYTFTLPDGADDLAEHLYALQLHPMEPASARLQGSRRERTVQAPKDQAVAERREALLRECVEAARGNPGLQDLLFDLALTDADAAAAALQEMRAYLERGDLPEQEKVQAFLTDLALDKLIGLAGNDGRELLRRMTLFELPVPKEVAALLADAAGEDTVERLLGLGLCDRYEDLADPSRPAAAIDPLARPRAGRLRETEQRTLAGRVLDRLLVLWGGEDGRSRPFLAAAS